MCRYDTKREREKERETGEERIERDKGRVGEREGGRGMSFWSGVGNTSGFPLEWVDRQHNNKHTQCITLISAIQTASMVKIMNISLYR